MLLKIRVFLLVAITAVLAACGGGGGDDTPNFAGRYQINAKLTGNSCNLSGLEQTVVGVDSVTQSGRNITYISEGINRLQGSVDADNGGYTATGTQVESGITFALSANYKTSSAYEMKLVANGCTIIYTGTATKI